MPGFANNFKHRTNWSWLSLTTPRSTLTPKKSGKSLWMRWPQPFRYHPRYENQKGLVPTSWAFEKKGSVPLYRNICKLCLILEPRSCCLNSNFWRPTCPSTSSHVNWSRFFFDRNYPITICIFALIHHSCPICSTHRIHGAGIYANMTGVYGW